MKKERMSIMKLNDITAVILTKNEETNINRALKSVQFCENIIVIDDYSSDKTIAIAKRHKAAIFKHHLENDFAQQRNFALSKVGTMWALFIDADEVVSKKLRQEILAATASATHVTGYYLRRKDIFNNKVLSHGEWGNAMLLRLARVSSGRWSRPVHEVWNINGMSKELTQPLLHYGHDTIKSFVSHILRYSNIHSKQKRTEDNAIIHTIGYPTAKFMNNYIVRLGFLDGVEGLMYSVLMSLHSFLAWNDYYENK